MTLVVRWRWFGAGLLALAALLSSWNARAQPPDEAEASELATLEQEMDEALASLATAECSLACQALESMMRAADRICALAPGARCDQARRKVAAARETVRQRCPGCAAAAVDRQAPAPLVEEQEDDAAEPSAGAAEPADAPPAAEATGGCAACALGRRSDGPAGIACLLGAALLVARRRRRRR